MPNDNPYNRKVADQYNRMNQAKVDHETATHQFTVSAPAGYTNNGYEPRAVGSGVGIYKKGKICPKGHAVCSCPSGSGISATICGRGKAHGGNNPGLDPAVRTELALGAGLRGDSTSKRGCLDHHEMMAHGKAHGYAEGSAHGGSYAKAAMLALQFLPMLFGKGDGGLQPTREMGNRFAQQNRRQANCHYTTKGQLISCGKGKAHGKAHGGKLKGKNPLSSGPVSKPGDKKESVLTIDNLVKGVETAEKVGKVIEKVADLGPKAWKGLKGLFGKGEGGRPPARRGMGKAHGKAHGATVTVKPEHRHARAVRGVAANGKAHGKSRTEIVKDIMNKMGKSMIEASKYVKAHGLY
jgi:hypothetical protein